MWNLGLIELLYLIPVNIVILYLAFRPTKRLPAGFIAVFTGVLYAPFRFFLEGNPHVRARKKSRAPFPPRNGALFRAERIVSSCDDGGTPPGFRGRKGVAVRSPVPAWRS